MILNAITQKYRDNTPQGAGIVHVLQIISKVSASIMSCSIILYITKVMHISDMVATGITGTFIALSYFLHLAGGHIGGRFLSYRSLFTIGSLLEMFGCLVLMIPNQPCLLWGLALFACGYGLNVSCYGLLTQLFDAEDKTREFSFLWNYSGLNVSYFIGYLIAGYFYLYNEYKSLFLICIVTKLLGMVIAFYYWHSLREHETLYAKKSAMEKPRSRKIAFFIIFCSVIFTRTLLGDLEFCNELIWIVTGLVLAYLLLRALKQKSIVARDKMLAFLILATYSMISWTLQYIAPMGLNLFTDRNVNRNIDGILFAPQWIMNINNLIPIVFGPLLGFLFIKLRARGVNINLPLQFALALFIIGLSYIILPIGIYFANSDGYSHVSWILISYALLSIGDLLVSPIGYAMVGQLAPANLRNFMMGTVLMLGGSTSLMADHLSKLMLSTTNTVDPLLTNHRFSHTFGMLGIGALTASVILFYLVPFLVRLTQEKLTVVPKTVELSDSMAA